MPFLGIDIGGTFTKYGIIENGQVINKWKVLTPKDNYCEFLKVIEKILINNSKNISGVGISIPGKVDCDTGLIQHGGALPYLHNRNIKNDIKKILDIPIKVENDGNAATLAEYEFGNLKNINNGGAIILGTGVGSGYILDGILRKGQNYQAGEISFMIQDNTLNGLSSFIAYKGSAVALVNKLANILGIKPEGKEVFNIIGENEEALKVLKEYCKNIAYLIYNIQTILDLDTYVIGGGISAQSIVIDLINEGYDEIFNLSPIIKETFIRPRIISAKFREDSNLIGATCRLKED